MSREETQDLIDTLKNSILLKFEEDSTKSTELTTEVYKYFLNYSIYYFFFSLFHLFLIDIK